MRKKILFAIIAILLAPCSTVMARRNAADRLIKENRDTPFTFYVNLTNRATAKHTYKKSLKKIRNELTEAYGDSISVDSVLNYLPLDAHFFDRHQRISKIKCKALITVDDEVKDFAAALDSAHDVYCLYELSSKEDTVMLDGKYKEIAQTMLSMVKDAGGISFYTTPYPFGFVMVLYSESRKTQSLVYLYRRPFRIIF